MIINCNNCNEFIEPYSNLADNERFKVKCPHCGSINNILEDNKCNRYLTLLKLICYFIFYSGICVFAWVISMGSTSYYFFCNMVVIYGIALAIDSELGMLPRNNKKNRIEEFSLKETITVTLIAGILASCLSFGFGLFVRKYLPSPIFGVVGIMLTAIIYAYTDRCRNILLICTFCVLLFCGRYFINMNVLLVLIGELLTFSFIMLTKARYKIIYNVYTRSLRKYYDIDKLSKL